MKKIENKFNYLLMVFVALFVVSPIKQMASFPFPVSALVFLLAIVLTLKSVTIKPAVFWVQVALSATAFVLTILVQRDVLSENYGVIASTIYAVFMAGAICVLLKRLITEKQIKVDTIKGGICIYFLIGFLWAMIYMVIYALDPSSFSSLMGNGATIYHELSYYSFTVLTTLGFGDITSENLLVRNLSTLEAIVGQIFLAVFVARLMGLYLAKELQE